MSKGAKRELVIRYNGVQMGGSAKDYRLTGYHRISQEAEVASAEWEVMVVATSEASFRNAVEKFEREMAKPWRGLTIKSGDTTLLEAIVSDSTALNAVPTVTKIGDPGDTGRTRVYRVRVVWGRPATYNSESEGLRTYDIDVSVDDARIRTVTIRGTYTAVGTNRSRAQYDAKIDAFQTAVLGGLPSGTFEIVSEGSAHDVNDATLRFSRVLREVIHDQGGAGLDNSTIIGQVLTISVRGITAEAHPSSPAKALTEITANYTATIDADVSTDLAAEWDTIKPWIIEQMDEYAEGSVAVRAVTPSLNPDANRITATVVAVAIPAEAFVELRVESEDSHSFGTQMVHAWSGSPFTKHIFQGAGSYIRRHTLRALVSGTKTKADAFAMLADVAGADSVDGVAASEANGGRPITAPQAAGAGRWYTLDRDARTDPYVFGTDDGTTVNLTAIVAYVVRGWAVNAEDLT